MKIDILHEKFLTVWKSGVAFNLWQAKSMHMVFLSQLLGRVPAMSDSPIAKSTPGLRCQHSGKWINPRLNYFVIAPSGTGKGQGQKVLLDLVRYFNMKTFAQRYGVTDLEKDLWSAYERFRKARDNLVNKPHLIALEQDPEEEEKEEGEPATGVEGEKKTVVTNEMPYQEYVMSKYVKTQFQREVFDLRSGKFWEFFTDDSAMYLPMHVQSSGVSRQFLTGGKDDVPTGTGTLRVAKPGNLETKAIFAWDEGRNILFAKTKEEVDLNTTLCTALDVSGKISSSARKDLDVFGNMSNYVTDTSIIAGTTEVEGLSDMMAGNGFLQRFLLGYNRSTYNDDIELSKAICDVIASNPNKTMPNLDAYYQEIMKDPIFRGKITYSPEATEVAKEYTEKAYEEIKEMFSAETIPFKIAKSFINRHIVHMHQIASIIAALENKDTVGKEHMQKAYDFIEPEVLGAIVDIVDECVNSERNAGAIVQTQLDAILMEIMRSNYRDGRFVTELEILNKVKTSSLASKWNKGLGASRKYIVTWAQRSAEKLRVRINPDTGEKEYALRSKLEVFEQAQKEQHKKVMEDLKGDVVDFDDKKNGDWVKNMGASEILPPQNEVELEDADLLADLAATRKAKKQFEKK